MENIDELTIMNDVVFGVVMRQEKYCKPLLEFILGIKIKKIVYENDQETISAPVIKAKSIRLDVYACIGCYFSHLSSSLIPAYLLDFGSYASRRPSPTKLNAITVRQIRRPTGIQRKG